MGARRAAVLTAGVLVLGGAGAASAVEGPSTGRGAARESGVREVSARVVVTGVSQSAADSSAAGSRPASTATGAADAAETVDAAVLSPSGGGVRSAAPLPRTGLETVALLLAGTGLVTVGAALLLLVERRARSRRRRPAVA